MVRALRRLRRRRQLRALRGVLYAGPGYAIFTDGTIIAEKP